jgi:DNA polymerase III gamma/tau subunit
LEEPPKAAVLILLSQTEREFLPTILSRLAKIRLPEPEITVSNLKYLTNISGLSWQDPSEIFQLAKELADLEEEDLKVFLKDIAAGLRMALQFKEGLRSKEETPEVLVKIADKIKSAAKVRSLLEKALSRRQDILRGRATTRLALETLFISLSEPPAPSAPLGKL